jgi:hypothetical protein
MQNFRKFFLVVCFIFSLSLPGAVRAQSSLEIDRLQVDVWPEFDRPDVLVIYHISLPADVVLPVTMTLRLPVQSGGPFNLAMKDADGLLYNLDYGTPVVKDPWLEVTFTSPSPEIQLEYYDRGIQRSGNQRTYEYRWPGDYAVRSFTIQVQQPANATNMQIQPSMGSGNQSSDGFYYFTEVVGRVEAAIPLVVHLSYEKPDNSLSSTSQPVRPVETVSANTSGRTSFQEALPWVLGALGVLLIGSGAIWFWQSDRKKSASPGRRRHARDSSNPAKQNAAGAEAQNATFCHQCGRQAASGDVFCRTCGTRLRGSE